MVVRNRLPPWHEQLQLADGREMLIRPIRPDDALPLRAGFALLQPDAIRERFLHGMEQLTPELAERLTHPDPKREFVLVAAEPSPPGEALVGAVARVAILDGGREAEFAVVVSSFLAGQGLGRHLMRRLVRWARGKPLERLFGDVPGHNEALLELAGSIGFRRERLPDSPELVRLVLELQSERRAPSP